LVLIKKDKEKIIVSFQKLLEEISSKKKKEWWEKYMRNVIKFRGVGIPDIRKLQLNWYKEYLQHLSYEEQIEIAIEFFREELAEDKLAGVLLFQNYLFDSMPTEYMLKQYETIFDENLIYDWNICDWFCVRVLNPTIKRDAINAVNIISSWKDEVNLWKARASVVSFIGLTKDSSYYSIIFENCSTLIKREERFAKTAVGWILHDIYKEDEEVVFEFINNNISYFDKESLKNSLKYADIGVQKDYLKKLKDYCEK